MDAADRTVKRKRAYDASGRRQQAEQTRDRLVEAAEARFLRHGYAATTVAAIATDVGVSVDTVYKAFGGKGGLVLAVRDRALRGSGPVPAEDRSDALHRAETDPRQIVAGWARLSREIAPRVSPILLLIRDAARDDPEVASLAAQVEHDRWARMHHNAQRLADGGHLRPGITAEHAADVLWTYTSPELYELIALRRGWSADDYAQFIFDGITGSLL